MIRIVFARMGCCKSFRRHGFSEEVTLEGDLRISWGLTREEMGERGPRSGNHRSKGSEVGGCGTERVASWRD